MTHTDYFITAFRFNETFDIEAKARKRFEEIKTRFTYCELKQAETDDETYYYAKSLEIYRK